MKRLLLAALAASAFSIPALAQEDIICMDCHEPAEDWEGLTPDEILKGATDPENKRHADNAEFTEEQLKAMIAQLLGGDG